MGKFSQKIVAEYNPPRKWILEEPLSYTTDLDDVEARSLELVGVNIKNKTITVDKGFVTDLASVPRAAWAIIAPWDVARSAIIHDLLYKRIRQYRWLMKDHEKGEDKKLVKTAKIIADKVFHQGMKDADPKVSGWKIYCAWKAVDLFGRWSIKPNESNI